MEHPRKPRWLPDQTPRWLIERTPRWLTERTPQWLSSRESRWKLVEKLPLILRPRLTWRYILLSLIILYILYCLLRGSPLLASNLPQYSGPHGVGAIDLEIPLDRPRKISETAFKSTGKPAFELETVLFTIYYPALKTSRPNKPNHKWIPSPISLTAKGYARFAHVDNFIIRPIFHLALWGLAGSISIPAKVDVPLLEKDDEPPKFPIMVFSHGMASSRTQYSHYCGELASRGFVIAAIEHRDGSGPGTIIMNDGQERKLLHFDKADVVSDPPMTTAKIKEEQLAFRDAEIKETIKVFQSINAAEGDEMFRVNPRKEGQHLQRWSNRLDFDHLLIGGHSYGATGVLQALKGPPSESNPAVGGIALDPGKSSGPLNHDISVPILVVHSNSWSKSHSIFFGRPHFDTVKELVEEVKKRVGASWFMTSIGTSHPSVTDAPLIEPLLLSWTTGARIDVHEGLRQYVDVSEDFFGFVGNGGRSGVLNQSVTHPTYDEDARSEARKQRMSHGIGKYWQIHVVPDGK
ncbi:PAF acetylhydrolase [Tothia fuscella]|uniref:Putative phospholipase n=1 Tax=Tothia fuscella TaxID=1048955 RepID=A0A9P4U0W3_9PEZI|nr:PAF acetylhydrolase [Tothia fuscella]